MADKFESLDFIFAGVREFKGTLCMAVIPLRDGEMLDANFYKGKPKSRWAVGGIYQGAEFGDGQAKGLDSASFKARWHDASAIMDWQARNDEAESVVRCLKAESDARKRNEIEACMLPLREQYTRMQRRRDTAGLAALESAVLKALRAPVRKNEAE